MVDMLLFFISLASCAIPCLLFLILRGIYDRKSVIFFSLFIPFLAITQLFLVIYFDWDIICDLIYLFVVYNMFKNKPRDVLIAYYTVLAKFVPGFFSVSLTAIVFLIFKIDIYNDLFTIISFILIFLFSWILLKFIQKKLIKSLHLIEQSFYVPIGLMALDLLLGIYYTQIHLSDLYLKTMTFSTLLVVTLTLISSAIIPTINRRNEKKYQKKLETQELNNLRLYTRELEARNLQSQKFNHDHKNLLLSLAKVIDSGDIEQIQQAFSQLIDYTKVELRDDSPYWTNLQNIKNEYLKSILIQKISELENMGVDIRFECVQPIYDFMIEDYDLVRLFANLLDNARDALKKSSQKFFEMSCLENEAGITMILSNSHQETIKPQLLDQAGYSTKDQHSGLGLSITQDIQNKYPEKLWVIKEPKEDIFTTTVMITR